MSISKVKNIQRERRRKRVRSKIYGTPTRPRLAVFRSLKYTYAQVIDDTTGRVIAASSSREVKSKGKKKTQLAYEVGERIAKKCLEKKISEIVFDRSRFQYHGRVKALADGARKGGLKF